MELEILYEDNDLVAINKPAGLMVHADGKNDGPFVCDWFLGRYPDAAQVGEPQTLQNGVAITRPGVVHRLDRETSGVMVLAKTSEAHAHLKQQFQGRTLQKTYGAVVWGEPKQDEGVIDLPIGRSGSKKGPPRWSATRGAKGTLREARTEYQVLNRQQGFSLLELRPKTGRTHQLRVHLQALQHPIVCDRLYAPKRACELGFGRVALHAQSLSVVDLAGEPQTFTAEWPEDFRRSGMLPK